MEVSESLLFVCYSSPMSFNSLLFLWVFLPIVLLVYWKAPERFQNGILLFFSLCYWAWNDPYHFLFILLISLLVYGISRQKVKTSSKVWLGIGWVLSIGLIALGRNLSFFSYPESFPIEKWNIPPMGISFLTFSMVSYLMDLYRNIDHLPSSIMEYYRYLLFFPKMFMGPIESYQDFLNAQTKTLEWNHFYEGVTMYLCGLIKKVLVADLLVGMVNVAFGRMMEVSSTVL